MPGAAYRDIDKDESWPSRRSNPSAAKRSTNAASSGTPPAKEIDLERDQAKIKVIERFSDDYFKLVKANTQPENAVLASQKPGEELVLKLRGQVYRIQ